MNKRFFILSFILFNLHNSSIHSANQKLEIPYQYGHSETTGDKTTTDGKPKMEDFSQVHTWNKNGVPHTLFLVCDGHEGDTVARILTGRSSEHQNITSLSERIQTQETFQENDYKKIFKETQESIEEIGRTQGEKSGSTVVLAHLYDKKIDIVSLGDSCAFIVDNKSKIVLQTQDHNLKSGTERALVKLRNGTIENNQGVSRVNGHINTTRSFEAQGFNGKYKGLTCEPTIKSNNIEDANILVLASNGAFDVRGDRLRTWAMLQAALQSNTIPPCIINGIPITTTGNDDSAKRATRNLCNIMHNVVYHTKSDNISAFLVFLRKHSQAH